MKPLRYIPMVLAAALLASPPPAGTQEIVVAIREGYEGETIHVPVHGAAAPGVSAMACRVAFDTDALDVDATSTYFASFAEQFRLSGVIDPGAVDVEVAGESFDAPFLVRPSATGLTIAGARREPPSDPAPTLFTLNVRLKTGSSPGLYTITLDSVVATAPAAGYPAGGATIPLLLGFNPTTGTYPVLAEITPGNRPVSDGSAHIFPADTDRDGLSDAWELLHYPDLATADGGSDTDGDDLPALLEQLFASNPTIADGGLVTAASLAGERFAIQFPRMDQTTFIIEWSTDLEKWSTEGVTIEERPDLGTGPDWTMQEASVSSAGRRRLLIRIRPTVPTIVP